MGANSWIAWCDHTFNGWIGCEKISPACAHCYAEVDTYSRVSRSRGLPLWGPGSSRHVTSPANWKLPLRWQRDAQRDRVRRRVFAHSLSDVCEDRRELDAPRAWLAELIRVTSFNAFQDDGGLDWMLLTKRPENLTRTFPEDVLARCYVGTTVESQDQVGRLEHVLAAPAWRRFVSVEPMLGRVDLSGCLVTLAGGDPADFLEDGPIQPPRPRLDLVICGGESGPKARPFDLAWPRALRDQCRGAGVAFFLKQLGARVVENRPLERFETFSEEGRRAYPNGAASLVQSFRLLDRAGADPSEWPEDLRVREWPAL